MPIVPAIETRRIGQEEFKRLSFEVMKHVFDIHNDFGRLFDETIYKKELAARMSQIQLEVPVDVIHGAFFKRYYADVIAERSALFEFKATEAIHPRHRAQTIHYLRLFGLCHGKILNIRLQNVEHEFVNCHQHLDELRQPSIDNQRWDKTLQGTDILFDTVVDLVKDWGTGLDLGLYEEAVTHFLGGPNLVESQVPVSGEFGFVGNQRMLLCSPHVAFKITSHSQLQESYGVHTRRLVQHTPLRALCWINISNHQVSFNTIHR